MADANSTQQTNSLSIDYGLRFDEEAVRDSILRSHINGVLRKMRAMAAISTILQADSVEREAQENGACLSPVQSGGLFDALVELSHAGDAQAEDIGLRLIQLSKSAA